MEYNEFINELKKCIEQLCDENETVCIKNIEKNNSQKQSAFVIGRKGENTCPAVHADYYYELYKKGTDLTEAAEKILTIAREHRDVIKMNINDFLEWNRIKDSVLCRIINKDSNGDLLKNIPHKTILDLAFVYFISIPAQNGERATALIRNEILKEWNISCQELHKRAVINTRMKFKPVIKTMNEIILDFAGDDESIREQMENDDSAHPMYVLTNSIKFFGAVCMMYEDVLNDFAEKNGDFYIIPSSVHEVILVPDEDDITPSGLLNMVSDVNDSQVPKEEILSYNVYHYDSLKSKLEVLRNVKQNFQ